MSVVEVSQQRLETFVEQTDCEQVLLPDTESVSVQRGSEVTWDGRDVGVGRAQVEIQTDFLLLTLEGKMRNLTVAEAGTDFLGLTKGQFRIVRQLLFARIRRIGVRLELRVQAGAELVAWFVD